MTTASDASRCGRRFGDDLRRIRERREVSREAVVAATRAPAEIVEEFESTGLVGHPMYNRVYLRSFVRGYAGVVGVSAEDVLQALDRVLNGTYSGELSGDSPPEASDAPAGEAAAAAAPADAPSEQELPPDPVRPVLPDVAPVPEAPRRGMKPVLLPSRPEVLRYAAPVVSVAVLAAIVWFLWPDSSPPPAPPPAPVVEQDTVQVDPLPPRRVLTAADSFYVVAVSDTLNPVRVTVDRGVRRPYWIEIGDSIGFEVERQMVIERELDRLGVSVAGIRLPTARRDSLGRMLILRADAQAWLDTLRAQRRLPTG